MSCAAPIGACRVVAVTAAIAVAALGAGCDSLERCESTALRAGARSTCALPGWSDRPFDITPPNVSPGTAQPLLIAFHGGGGNHSGAIAITCPDGDREDPACLDTAAVARGFVVVAPNGTGARPLRNSRTWNAGGGNDGYYCSAGAACASGVDDLSYIDELIDEVARLTEIDPARIYLTGLSNGSSISHRFACERSERIAAIGTVGGPNQHAESGGACAGGVAVLQIHGTDDPCAHWEDSERTSCSVITLPGKKVGVPRTMEGWRVRNGCDASTVETPLPDLDPNDGSTATRVVWDGCDTAVELIRIDGGGHTWPGGDQYLSASDIGRLNRDFSATETLLDFFEAHAKP